MTIQVKVIADSTNGYKNRITTFQLMYPRFIHSELMTHRVFSRNASSSRAIPVKKMLEMVHNDPATPIHWGKNQPGMQANEQLTGEQLVSAKDLWITAAQWAASIAQQMMEAGLHKQVANRILEPFQHISVVLTATEFGNWFDLRAHPDAQPEIQALACAMREAMKESKPERLYHGEWHLPYVTAEELASESLENLIKVSAARCCRVSYLKHDGSTASIEEDLALCERLAGAEPIHASPFEHQATPDEKEFDMVYSDSGDLNSMDIYWQYPELHGNFNGWIQYRKQLEKSFK